MAIVVEKEDCRGMTPKNSSLRSRNRATAADASLCYGAAQGKGEK